jgi:myo-inositol-1(or 4)-monophosphatase
MDFMPSERGAAGPSGAPSAKSAIDWADVCRRAVESMKTIFADAGGIEGRTRYEGVGEGGDDALVIDRRSEDAVFAELERVAAGGASFVAISEERGEVSFGGGDTRVVIDPVDGSLNARRTIPAFALSLAVTSGPSMADVEFAYVYDFGPGEEFVASRGGGATLDGTPIAAHRGERVLELVGIEAAKPELAVPVVAAMQGFVYRLRGVGAIAINLAWVAAGRLDGMVSLRPCRSVDAAAGQLLVREAGGEVDLGDRGLGEVGLGLDERFPIVAASSPEGARTLREAQRTGEE